jgi:hypothetical protein
MVAIRSSLKTRLDRAEQQTETIVSATGEIRGFSGISIIFLACDDEGRTMANLPSLSDFLLERESHLQRGSFPGCMIYYPPENAPLEAVPESWLEPVEEPRPVSGGSHGAET